MAQLEGRVSALEADKLAQEQALEVAGQESAGLRGELNRVTATADESVETLGREREAAAEMAVELARLREVAGKKEVSIRAWNIHTFFNFDEFSMKLSPKLVRDSQLQMSTIQKRKSC